MSTMPTRVDRDLYDAARSTGAATSRSAAQQLNHWARIGREFEASPGVRQRDIERVLAGDGSYDTLSEREQAIVRAAWDQRMTERRGALNFEEEFAQAGEAWSEADADGHLVVRTPQHADA